MEYSFKNNNLSVFYRSGISSTRQFIEQPLLYTVRYASPETPSSIAQPSRADSVCEESSHPLPIVESRIEQHHQELE